MYKSRLNVLWMLSLCLLWLASGAQTWAQTNNQVPVPRITINPGVVVVGDDFQTEVILDARSSYDLDGEIVSFRWELQGGNIIEGADSVIAIATFPGIRDYPVTLTVTDNHGATATAESVVIAKDNQAPEARIQILPPVVSVGDNFQTVVTLDARSSFDIDGEVVAFQWELNGGQIIEGENSAVAKATFPGIRNYPVTLTVTDNNGATAQAQDEVIAGPAQVRVVEALLIEAGSDEVVKSLQDGDVIDLEDFPDGFSIQALTDPEVVGGVVFNLNGEDVQFEGIPPYTLFGDINRANPVDILGGTLAPGAYELILTPNTPRTETQEPRPGTPLKISFEVVDGDDRQVVEEFVLIDAGSDEIVGTLQEGDVINLGEFPEGFSIIANTSPEIVGSVEFFLNNAFARIENITPYSLNGDANGDFAPLELAPGSYTLRATPFSERRAQGEAGDALTINFEVIEGDVNPGNAVVRLTLVDPSAETVSLQNFGDASQDLSAFQFCLGPGQYNALSNYTNLSGDLNLEPGEVLEIDLTSGTQNVQALPDAQGALILFAVGGNFGSSDPEILLDFVQWGVGNQNRVAQGVAAGRWPDANEFVAGAAPYTFVGNESNIGADFWIDDTNIRLVEITPAADEVVLRNFDQVERDLSGYFFCTQPGVYPQLGNDSQVEILAGDLTLAPGEEVRVRVLTAGGVLDNEASIFLFSSNVLGFNNQNAAVTRDFAQWGAPNGFRVENAVATGRWDNAANFIEGGEPFTYIGDGNDVGGDFWEGVEGEAIIRLLQVDLASERITLKNFGTATRDLSTFWFCLGPGQYNALSNYTNLSGDLTLEPNEELTIDLTSGSQNVQALPDAQGALILFAVGGNFGSSDPEILLDFVQWGVGNQNRVGQAVTAGRWPDANEFVAGVAPYNYVGGATDIGADFWEATAAGEAAIRITFVNPNEETVTVQNLGTAAQNISAYWFCLGPGQYNPLNNYTDINGDLDLAPGEAVTFNLTSGSQNVQALPDANGGLGLFANTNFSSNSANDLKDYLQWGAGNQNRVSQAVNAGRWPNAGDFVDGTAPYTFIGNAENIGANFWEASSTINVFPNPSTGRVNVEGNQNANYELRDPQGNLILDGKFEDGKASFQLNRGTYLLMSSGEIRRIIVQ